jgi:hypothetical protein
MSSAPSVSHFQAEADAQAPGLPLFDYSADEVGGCPNLNSTIQQWAVNMHKAGINNLITMSPRSALLSDGSGTGRSAVDIWVMLPIMYDNARSAVAQALHKGDLVWSYNDLVLDSYSPKWEIDFDPINFRIQPGFISQSLGLTGLLYWRVDEQVHNPWSNVNNAGFFSADNFPGEGQLFYPGSDVGVGTVVPSMRLKWLRDGVEDYEYVEILKKLGNPTVAIQIAQSVGPDWTHWTRNAASIEAARTKLGTTINQMVSSGPPFTPGPSPSSNPSPANSAVAVTAPEFLSWWGAADATSYDVYFGTSTTPPFKGTVRSTS